MPELFPFKLQDVLYLYDSTVDMYLDNVKGAFTDLDSRVLQHEEKCRIVVVDYVPVDSRVPQGIIRLGLGYHPSDYEDTNGPWHGLVFCIDPPFHTGVKEVRFDFTKKRGVLGFSRQFKAHGKVFEITDQEVDLDLPKACGYIGKRDSVYQKGESLKWNQG